MRAKIKLTNSALFTLLLIPAPWFCGDFVPNWLTWSFSALLFARIFRPFPPWLALPISYGMGYLSLKAFGYRLVPESAISFLNCMVLAKLLLPEKKFSTDIILGVLWVGTFSVFNSTLYYLAYLALFFLVSVNLLKKGPDKAFEFKPGRFSLGPAISLAKTLPLVAALFLFFPRFRGFIPGASARQQANEVGYSKTIDNSSASELKLSSRTAFYAGTNRQLSPQLLYWRGRVHAHTDGYNWRPAALKEEQSIPLALGPSLEYELKYEQSLEGDMVLLETPVRMIGAPRNYELPGTGTYRSYRPGKKAAFTAISSPEGRLRSNIAPNLETYLDLPDFLPRAFRELSQSFSEKAPQKLAEEFARYLRANGFEYTLSPGPMPSLAAFIENKKGFCTHYASLLALLYRHKGIPARLVSGFQGGEYNAAGGFYTVRSSDAHAWVEYFSDSTWKRVDPTGFVSPSRIAQGGEQFLGTQAQNPVGRMFGGIGFFKDARQFISNINYKIALFLDDYDRQAQTDLAKELSLSLKSFYILGSLLALGLTLGLAIYMTMSKRAKLAPEERLFKKFAKSAERQGVLIKPSMSEEKIALLCREKLLKSDYLMFLDIYQKIKYGGQAHLLGRLRKITKSL